MEYRYDMMDGNGKHGRVSLRCTRTPLLRTSPVAFPSASFAGRGARVLLIGSKRILTLVNRWVLSLADREGGTSSSGQCKACSKQHREMDGVRERALYRCFGLQPVLL